MNGVGKLVLRATIGGYFVGHGMQKLAGWFGGGGPEGTDEHFEQIGLRPGRESALLAGASETGGGLLLALGLFTPASSPKAARTARTTAGYARRCARDGSRRRGCCLRCRARRAAVRRGRCRRGAEPLGGEGRPTG